MNISYTNIHSHFLIENDAIGIKNSSTNFSDFTTAKYCSIGIHPWYIKEKIVEQELFYIQQNSIANNVLAIGECGLDKLSEVDFQLQKNMFIAQLKISEQVKKPVIIHCVKAFDELIKIKKELNLTVPLIVHGYNNNKQIAEQLIKNGFYISFGKALLKPNSNAVKVISKIPMDKLFLETDDEDVSIKCIFEVASALLIVNKDELKEKIFSNFIKTFNINLSFRP